MDELRNILDEAIQRYSSNDYYEKLKSAKEEYFKLTGKLSEEDEDYESRMNGFVYWYITQRDQDSAGPLIKNYLSDREFSQIFDEKMKIAALICYRMYIATYESPTTKTKRAN